MPSNNAVNASNPVLQIVSTSIATLLTVNAAIPDDNTIPQNTEGVEVLTLAITPKLSTSTLEIIFSGMMTRATSTSLQVALFQDTTADALAAKCFSTVTVSVASPHLQYFMTSGTTSATTFKIRLGSKTTTSYGNGTQTGTQLYNGVADTQLTIIEYI